MKYEITDEVHPFRLNLRRIRALKDIPEIGVKAGDLGGYVEHEHNLSQDGNCWVADDAEINGEAKVIEDAQVFGNARILDNNLYTLRKSPTIGGNSTIFGRATVSGNVRVTGDASIFDDANVYGSLAISDNVVIHGESSVHGNSPSCYNHISGNVDISGKSTLNLDRSIEGNVKISGKVRKDITINLPEDSVITNNTDLEFLGKVSYSNAYIIRQKDGSWTVKVGYHNIPASDIQSVADEFEDDEVRDIDMHRLQVKHLIDMCNLYVEKYSEITT